jgi:hypothetical protein
LRKRAYVEGDSKGGILVKAGSDDMVEVSFVVSGVVVAKHLPPFYSELE